MSLAEEISKRKAQERADAARRGNPELEAELDHFIAENPRCREYYNAMSKEELVRKCVLVEMKRAATETARIRMLEQWVKENSDITAKVAQRVKEMVAGDRCQVRLKDVRSESPRERTRGPQLRP